MSPLSSTPTLVPSRSASMDAKRDPEKAARAPSDTCQQREGLGTADSPYVVRFAEVDEEDPMQWSSGARYLIVFVQAIATLCVAFASSVYAGGYAQMTSYFGASQELITAGLSLYVLGFAVGPLLWAPWSEMYGRRAVFIATYAPFALFHIGCALATNIETLLLCRFLAGFFGASPLTNSGGVISDMFSARERALAISLFSLAPFAGPCLGPISGGFLGLKASWRWLFWLCAIFSGICYVAGCFVPETYAPVLLRRRAARLEKETGERHISFLDLAADQNETVLHKIKIGMQRPFVLLFREVIVSLMAIYTAVVYGTLYLMFGAFPIVYQRQRGWNQGLAGLPFIGIGVGLVIGVIFNIYENKRYTRNLIKNGGSLPPEARLPLCCIGGVALPVGLFAFAWTVQPSVHWIVSCIATVPFGFGMVLVFLSIVNYTVDSYLMYAASALAANAVLRSIFGAVFPLFTRFLFEGLGTNWALTLVAFLSLALMPVPFIFSRYGARIRARSSFAPGHAAPSEKSIVSEVGQLDLARIESVKQDERDAMRQRDLNAVNVEKAGIVV